MLLDRAAFLTHREELREIRTVIHHRRTGQHIPAETAIGNPWRIISLKGMCNWWNEKIVEPF